MRSPQPTLQLQLPLCSRASWYSTASLDNPNAKRVAISQWASPILRSDLADTWCWAQTIERLFLLIWHRRAHYQTFPWLLGGLQAGFFASEDLSDYFLHA